MRVVFARVGWMRFYKGPVSDDEKPIGGGTFTKTDLGGEVFNFLPIDGKVFGYFQPALPPKRLRKAHPSHIALERVESGFQGASLDNVRVIFVATHPVEGKQRIVGWFPTATVYRYEQDSTSDGRELFPYYMVDNSAAAVLVPDSIRDFIIPRGRGGIGQANICYALDANGNPKVNASWIGEAVNYTTSYDRENSAQDPSSEADSAIAETIITALEHSAGFQSNPLIRKAIEVYAMEWALRYLTKLEFAPKDTHRNRPYDFICKIEGNDVFVEVKGMQDSGTTISLTPREVKHAQEHKNSALFIVHSVIIEDRGKPRVSGGVAVFRYPWDISAGILRPRGFVFTIED